MQQHDEVESDINTWREWRCRACQQLVDWPVQGKACMSTRTTHPSACSDHPTYAAAWLWLRHRHSQRALHLA